VLDPSVKTMLFDHCPRFGHRGPAEVVAARGGGTPVLRCSCKRPGEHTPVGVVLASQVQRRRRPDLSKLELVLWNERVMALAEDESRALPAVLLDQPAHVAAFWRGLVEQHAVHRRLGWTGAIPHARRWAMAWSGLSDHHARHALAVLRALGLVADGPPPDWWDTERPQFRPTTCLVAQGHGDVEPVEAPPLESPSSPWPATPARPWQSRPATPAQVAYADSLAARLGYEVCTATTRGEIGPVIARWRAELRGRRATVGRRPGRQPRRRR
jgi:hypothetical protein